MVAAAPKTSVSTSCRSRDTTKPAGLAASTTRWPCRYGFGSFGFFCADDVDEDASGCPQTGKPFGIGEEHGDNADTDLIGCVGDVGDG